MTDMSQTASPSTFSYLEFAALLLRRRRIIVTVGLVAAVLAATATLLRHRRWTVESSFIPQSRRQTAGLSGIAAQLGIAIPLGEPTQSPQFFEILLRGEGVVRGVVESEYDLPGEPGTRGTLVEYYEARDGSPSERLALAERLLRSRMLTSIDARAGLVTLRITDKSGEMAAQISKRFLEKLDEFNRSQRQSQASAERKFTERRMGEVREELLEAEGKLQVFLSRNRSVARTSEAAFEEDRLRANYQLKQQLFASLAQTMEQARIEEVRDTPVITLVDAPDVPLEPDRRWLLARTILAFLGAGILVVIILIVQGLLRGATRLRPDTASELVLLRQALWQDLRRPWRLIGFSR